MGNFFLFIIAVFLYTGMNAQTNTFPTSGNAGIGTTSPSYTLQVSGDVEAGDSHDGTKYGLLQIVRPANQGDYKFHLSFIRNGSSVSGMGYALNSNILGIWHANNNAGIPTMSFTPGQNVGIGTSNPLVKLQVEGGHIAAVMDQNLGGFVQLWTDNAVVWKNGNSNAGFRLGSATDLSGANWSEKMRILDNGKVGIGTSSIPYKLTLAASEQADGIWLSGIGNTNIALLNNTGPGNWNSLTQTGDNLLLWKGSSIDNSNAGGLVLGPWSNSATGMRISPSGNVAIGTADPGTYKLAVEGIIGGRKVKVTQSSWADYVFDDNYQLPTLAEVEEYIRIHKHLPEVPAAKQIEDKGLDLGDNQVLLLKKIEELTLYIIEQNKRIEKVEEKINQANR